MNINQHESNVVHDKIQLYINKLVYLSAISHLSSEKIVACLDDCRRVARLNDSCRVARLDNSRLLQRVSSKSRLDNSCIDDSRFPQRVAPTIIDSMIVTCLKESPR